MSEMNRPDLHSPASEDAALNEFASVRRRLEEIAHAVDDPELSLDAALDLYEEAVSLGLRASDLLEVDLTADEEQEAAEALQREDASSAPSSAIAGDEDAPSRVSPSA